jgi:hypothetical protein
MERAASQSKGMDEEIDGVAAGERRVPLIEGLGRLLMGVEGKDAGDA